MTISIVILVVEDELLIRMVAAESLADAGFTVIEASHAAEAMSILDSDARAIHAIFTDIHMPGTLDGLGLARLAREKWPWIPLLIASGKARPAPAELPAGSRFIAKPYPLDHMTMHLRELTAAV